MSGSEEQFKLLADWECYRLSKMQVYINLRSPRNAYELADVPAEKMKLYQTIFGKAHSEAVYKTRWVTTRFPNAASAQEANMSTEAYANDTERMNRILDTDEGARYIGEFALAFNPYILHPMNNTLFDEKNKW